MILDAIIGLFASVFGFLIEGVAMVVFPLVNLVAAALEFVVGIFVSGFSMGRLERKKGKASAIGGVVTLLIIGVSVCWLFIVPKVMNREVTLLAGDGHSLPFASIVIHTTSGDQYKRTDNAGNFLVPRFTTSAITVKDPRYVEKTWSEAELESELVVERTILGSSLDSLADKLLKAGEN